MANKRKHRFKTQAQAILEARREGYGGCLPGGFITETEALLMMQHFEELREREEQHKSSRKIRK